MGKRGQKETAETEDAKGEQRRVGKPRESRQGQRAENDLILLVTAKG